MQLAIQGMSMVLELSREVICDGLEYYAAASFRKAWKVPAVGAIALLSPTPFQLTSTQLAIILLEIRTQRSNSRSDLPSCHWQHNTISHVRARQDRLFHEPRDSE